MTQRNDLWWFKNNKCGDVLHTTQGFHPHCNWCSATEIRAEKPIQGFLINISLYCDKFFKAGNFKWKNVFISLPPPLLDFQSLTPSCIALLSSLLDDHC